MFTKEKEIEIAKHLVLLANSYASLTNKNLLTCELSDLSQVFKNHYHADFVLVSHNNDEDPCINFANLKAQRLWEMDYDEICGVPSRYTAEEMERAERELLLREVRERGFIDNYSGVRISKSGRRFLIENAVVWNVYNEKGEKIGQAAMFDSWKEL